MALSKTSNAYNRQNWENAEFPILCETCLGDNPYLRMIKEKYGKECKICVRPFTIFRWCPGAGMRFKKTEICQTCSRVKNICQTCLLDLEYGLPTQVRDSALQIQEDVPRSEVNREYYIQNVEESGKMDPSTPLGAVGKSSATSDLLSKFARRDPYYKRNRPHICSFWVKGECKRGESCPYRHDKPTNPDDPLANQNIKDRYYGINDPVAEKLMRRAAAMPKLEPPEDRSIMTLYVGNLGDVITEKMLRDHFYQYGEIRNITMVSRKQCAFIEYTNRSSAMFAADNTFNKLHLQGKKMVIKWGHSQGKKSDLDTEPIFEPVPGLPGALPSTPQIIGNNYFNLQPSSGQMPPSVIGQSVFPYHTMAAPTPTFLPTTTPIYYPSQNPSRMGTSQGIGKPWPEEN